MPYACLLYTSMRANGLEAAVLKEAAKGKIIFGICGGYQMLGETLSAPHHVEAGGTIKGMGLLPMDTVFAEKKTRTRVSGRFLELEGSRPPGRPHTRRQRALHHWLKEWEKGQLVIRSCF